MSLGHGGGGGGGVVAMSCVEILKDLAPIVGKCQHVYNSCHKLTAGGREACCGGREAAINRV